MDRKVVLITGGNSGIGFEAVKKLYQSQTPYHVIIASLLQNDADQAIKTLRKEFPNAVNTVEATQVDVTNDDSIAKLFEQVKANPVRLDILINNAGAFLDPAYLAGDITLRECFTGAYNVNVAGAHVMTTTFIPLLLKSPDPRLLFMSGLSHLTVASKKYFPTPPQAAGWPKEIEFETIGYRCTKSALNMLMLDWSFKLKEDGVKVWGVMPGMMATDIGGAKAKELFLKMGAGHPSAGGALVASVVEGERDADAGLIVERGGITPF